MYPSKRHAEVFLLAFSISLLFAPHGIAQPEATSNQLHQSSDEQFQSQSTSSSTSDLTPTTAIESTNQYTNGAIAEPLKAHKQHNENNLGQEKAADSSSQPSFKGYIRKFQQYQTLPEAAVTQQQTLTRENFYTPNYSGVPSQPSKLNFRPQTDTCNNRSLIQINTHHMRCLSLAFMIPVSIRGIYSLRQATLISTNFRVLHHGNSSEGGASELDEQLPKVGWLPPKRTHYKILSPVCQRR